MTDQNSNNNFNWNDYFSNKYSKKDSEQKDQKSEVSGQNNQQAENQADSHVENSAEIQSTNQNPNPQDNLSGDAQNDSNSNQNFDSNVYSYKPQDNELQNEVWSNNPNQLNGSNSNGSDSFGQNQNPFGFPNQDNYYGNNSQGDYLGNYQNDYQSGGANDYQANNSFDQFGNPISPESTPTNDKNKKGLREYIVSGLVGAGVAAVVTSGIWFGLDYSNLLGFDQTKTVVVEKEATSTSQSSSTVTKPSNSSITNPNWEAVAQATGPAVVSINISGSSGNAAGSGVIISSDGYVVTNNHVVEDAKTIQVTFEDGTSVDAKLIGTDATTDLAVIQLDYDKTVPFISLASTEVQVGQPVMACGNPLEFANSVSTGVVSALNRPVAISSSNADNGEIVTNMIQIDAAINPGNSGGPLFDGEGNIVGITSAIASTGSSDGSIGIGFAIPASLVNNVVTQIIENGSVTHAQIGVYIRDGEVELDGVTKKGALIDSLISGAPAEEAGLKANDLVVAVNGETIINNYAFLGSIHTFNPGETIAVTVIRDGEQKTINVTLTAAKSSSNEAKPEYPDNTTPEDSETQNPYEDEDGFYDPFGLWGW